MSLDNAEIILKKLDKALLSFLKFWIPEPSMTYRFSIDAPTCKQIEVTFNSILGKNNEPIICTVELANPNVESSNIELKCKTQMEKSQENIAKQIAELFNVRSNEDHLSATLTMSKIDYNSLATVCLKCAMANMLINGVKNI